MYLGALAPPWGLIELGQVLGQMTGQPGVPVATWGRGESKSVGAARLAWHFQRVLEREDSSLFTH